MLGPALMNPSSRAPGAPDPSRPYGLLAESERSLGATRMGDLFFGCLIESEAGIISFNNDHVGKTML